MHIMATVLDILIANPLLLLFVVVAIGYPLGRIKIGGASLGVAAVLFVGLAIGALHPDLKLPEIVFTLGLVLFVYTIGLSSGAVFFASLRQKGLRDNLLVTAGLLFATGLSGVGAILFNLRGAQTAGLFAGSLTNTPALAAAVERAGRMVPAQMVEAVRAEPVVAYSLTYPIGVIGVILAIYILQRLWRIDYAKEAAGLRELDPGRDPLMNRTVRVNHPSAIGIPVRDLVKRNGWNVLFGRFKHDHDYTLVTGATTFAAGDLVSIIGPEDALDAVTNALGEPANERLEQDLSQYDKRRFFLSNPDLAGKRLNSIPLRRQFGALITRIRRGDAELLPHGSTVLGLGDQVRVIAPHSQLDALARLFGDSYRAVSEIDILTFGLGLTLGLLAGLLPIPLPGGLTLQLGLAGGPLLVALVLGAVGRTGPMVWSLPYSANLTIRQIGLVFFLAGIGTRSGYTFVSTLGQGQGWPIFLIGAVVTTLTALVILIIGYKLLKIPMVLLIGIVAGMHTQPTVLGFALEQTQSELPNVGYATVYPLAVIVKILLVQLLLIGFGV